MRAAVKGHSCVLFFLIVLSCLTSSRALDSHIQTWGRNISTCSWLAADWSQTSAAAAPSPACWSTESSPEAGSPFEMFGSAPDGRHSVKSRKSAFKCRDQKTVTFASTTLSLRVCSAVCVRRFVPISNMAAVWLWTTCGGMLGMSGLILFWITFSSCEWNRSKQQKVKLPPHIDISFQSVQ